METVLLLARSWPLFLKGLLMTLQILVCSASLSSVLGFFFGMVTCNKLKVPFLSSAIESLTFILRAVPFFVQLLLVYFVLPDLLHLHLEPFPASVLALGLCSSGYVAQIVRGGLNSLPIAQWESAYVLGLNRRQSLRYVILPQLRPTILPMLNNELESLLKSTSIVSSIGVLELTRAGMNIVSREMQPVPIYLALAFFYIAMSSLFIFCARKLERRYAHN